MDHHFSSTESADAQLDKIEQTYPLGLSVPEILAVLVELGRPLSEATFRKYVQVGLLPKSVRVSRGKTRGSHGLYPASIVRRIDFIRKQMAEGRTIEEIQREVIFLRDEIEELSRNIDRVLDLANQALAQKNGEPKNGSNNSDALRDARANADALIRRLGEAEQQLSLRARYLRAAV